MAGKACASHSCAGDGIRRLRRQQDDARGPAQKIAGAAIAAAAGLLGREPQHPHRRRLAQTAATRRPISPPPVARSGKRTWRGFRAAMAASTAAVFASGA